MGWEASLDEISQLSEKQPRHSLKRRQLELMGAGVKQFKEHCDNQTESARVRLLEETKARWISSSMMKAEDADLLTSVEGPCHENIEKSRHDFFEKKRATEERALKEKACNYYQDEWVLCKEKDLQELQKQEDAATDPDNG